ncbi:BTB/POZ protein [Helicostylum pulchrum]|uniref:BTB domain-containing protein n=1 Tax=Helicostylum pulchrum TaxID=562976 RepID=A0ABP9YC37_9FUNG|nr:BTB/POZ protein [Helicostylum pulchrum]
MSKHKTIKLNVGGTFYETTQETLKGSGYFRNLLNEGWAEGNAVENTLFVDRDGFLFRFILLYLRTDELDIKDKYLKSLKNEADFYLLPRLSQIIERAMYQEPKKITYKLLENDELARLYGLDFYNRAQTRTPREERQNISVITPIQCVEQVYNCPRRIPVHNNKPNSCGNACEKAKGGNNYVEYEFKYKNIYLVSVESDQE